MADVFDAFFGAGSGLGEDSQPMINALRGQKREGDFAALSTIGQISADGRAQSNQALAAGERAGGLKLAREAEQRKKEQEAANAQRDHALRMALAKQRHAYTMEGKRFDVANRESGASGSQEASKAFKTYYRRNEAGEIEHVDGMQTRDGRVVDMGGNQLDSTWSLADPTAGTKGFKVKPDPVRVQLADGTEVEAQQGKDDGELYRMDTKERIDLSQGGKLLPPFKKYGDSTATKIKDKAKVMAQAAGVFRALKPEYANNTGVPYAGTLSNAASKYLPKKVSDEVNAKAEWWKKFKRFNELLTKKDFFGSAQSAQELKSYAGATIDENASIPQLQNYIKMMQRVMDAEIKADIESDVGLGYSESAAKAARGSYLSGAFDDALNNGGDLKMPEGQGWDQAEWDALSDEDKKLLLDNL